MLNKTLIYAEFDYYRDKLNIPQKIIAKAIQILEIIIDFKFAKSKNEEELAAALIYMACRYCGMPYTFEEIEDVSNLSKKEIARTYRQLIRLLHIKMPKLSALDYIDRFASKLELPSSTKAEAIEIIKKAEDADLTLGRDPSSIAAASIYIASKYEESEISKSDIAKVLKVDETLIQKRCSELSKIIDF